MDNGLCDGLWHFVMVEHNSMEVMIALDIETVVTKAASNIPHDFSAHFVQVLSMLAVVSLQFPIKFKISF